MAKHKSTANPQRQELSALREQHPPPNPDAAAQAVETAGRPAGEAAAKPETQQVATVQSGPASPADIPPEAQPTVAEIEEQRGLDEEKREQHLTPTQRIDRLEAALGSGAGLNVRNFTHLSIHMERNAIVAEAMVKAADLIHDALVDAVEGLTLKERLDRAEAALRSAKTLGNLI